MAEDGNCLSPTIACDIKVWEKTCGHIMFLWRGCSHWNARFWHLSIYFDWYFFKDSPTKTFSILLAIYITAGLIRPPQHRSNRMIKLSGRVVIRPLSGNTCVHLPRCERNGVTAIVKIIVTEKFSFSSVLVFHIKPCLQKDAIIIHQRHTHIYTPEPHAGWKHSKRGRQ